MTASIRLNGSTTPLQVLAGVPVSLTNFDNTGVAAWEWTLLDRPSASAASITGASSAAASLTPDVPGSYLVRLRTWRDAGATILDDVDRGLTFVRYVAAPTWRVPAAGETTEANATRGWAAEMNDILDYIQSSLGGGGGITELTGDVTAGPGSGAQAAVVVALQGNPVSAVAPGVGEVPTWDGAAWTPTAIPASAPFTYAAVTASGALPAQNAVIDVDTSFIAPGALALTLPAASAGLVYIIRKVDGPADRTISIVRAAAESIDGVAATRVLYGSDNLIDAAAFSLPHAVWMLYCDGTNWRTFSLSPQTRLAWGRGAPPDDAVDIGSLGFLPGSFWHEGVGNSGRLYVQTGDDAGNAWWIRLDAVTPQSIAASTVLTNKDAQLFVDTTGGDVALTLPNPVVQGAGRRFKIVKTNTGTGKITLTRYAAENINGAAADLDLPGSGGAAIGTWDVSSDGTDWWATQVGASALGEYIFQPGGTASGNTYDSFAALYAAASAETVPITVLLDDSLGALDIPAATYDFDGWTFKARGISAVSMTMLDGVRVPYSGINAYKVRFENVALTFDPGGLTQSVFFDNGGGSAPTLELTLVNSSIIGDTANTMPMIEASPAAVGANVAFTLYDSMVSEWSVEGDNAAAAVGLTVTGYGYSFLADSAFQGTATALSLTQRSSFGALSRSPNLTATMSSFDNTGGDRVRINWNESQTGTTELSIGMIYLLEGTVIPTANVMIGALGGGTDSATLRLRQFTGGTLIETWTVTGAVAETGVAAPIEIANSDWYEWTLAAGDVAQTALAKGALLNLYGGNLAAPG